MRAQLLPQEAKRAAAASAAATLRPGLPRCPAGAGPQGRASRVCPVLRAQGASSAGPPRLPSKMPGSRERELAQLRERQRVPRAPRPPPGTARHRQRGAPPAGAAAAAGGRTVFAAAHLPASSPETKCSGVVWGHDSPRRIWARRMS